MYLWLLLVTGVAYPLFITLIAQGIMRDRADGGIIVRDGKPIGASLIAQKFESDKYFWPRPSSVDYNPLPSGGSNLGPTSSDLKKSVEERQSRFATKRAIPSELLFASGSGLDPHISPKAAYFQVERIVKARGIDPKTVAKLIEDHTEGRLLGFIGEPCVNVLLLNRALD